MPKNASALDQLDPKEYIVVKGARVNNLKGLSVAIPRNTMTVVTGVSGSGKSSLAFDTIYAEGQRQYVESLSSYARQFLGRMEKPEVDYIKGLSPAVAIEQRASTKNPRSTVGTSTEIYDYLKLLFARIGQTISPVSGKPVRKHAVADVVNHIQGLAEGTKVQILTPLVLREDRSLEKELELLQQKGYSRIQVEGVVQYLDEVVAENIKGDIFILLDRLAASKDEELGFRIADSAQTAFFEGEGVCIIEDSEGKRIQFSDRFELDGISFEEPTANFFAFNNPYGACKTCEGFGHVLGVDPDKVFPDKSLSIYEGLIAPWRTEKMKVWNDKLVEQGINFDFPIHRPYSELTPDQQELLWEGNDHFEGLNDFFAMLEAQTMKIQYRVRLSRYRGRTVCADCKGTRLRKDTDHVLVGGKTIKSLVLCSVNDAIIFFKELTLDDRQNKMAERLLMEIRNRLGYLEKVGLGYLTLNRMTATLSGGEFQRIKLATSLGSALVGSMYVLDEPSIGLHPRDTTQLVEVLLELRDLGNTVIVVEHEEEIMRAADYIIDIGPDAGSGGGELVFDGNHKDFAKDTVSYTSRFLNGLDEVTTPEFRRTPIDYIEIIGASENNLKNIDVKIPLGVMSVITGVSGSGKSTLVRKILYPALQKMVADHAEFTGAVKEIKGGVKQLSSIEFVDQNPIGKSSRSNPVTYIKAYDEIRALFASSAEAKARGYKPSFFSFNVEGGRCETCQGEGVVRIEMQFMADIELKCEGCKGQRFKEEVLDAKYNGKSISQVLTMTVDEALAFFEGQKKIISKLQPLADVGLGYIALGQASNSLSGGEAQRVKLASFLTKGAQAGNTLFIFDEPTTGLHFHDIQKLLDSFNALVNKGHSLIVIEHNLEVIKCADWITDLGPEGGDEGGYVVYEGKPEGMLKVKEGHTAKYLKEKL
jgi:excinuclease ABC subunit A